MVYTMARLVLVPTQERRNKDMVRSTFPSLDGVVQYIPSFLRLPPSFLRLPRHSCAGRNPEKTRLYKQIRIL